MKINLWNLNNFTKNVQNSEKTSDQIKADNTVANTPKEVVRQNNVVLSSNLQGSSLTRSQQAILIRELLSLPKDLKEFLSLLVYKEITQESLSTLLQEQNRNILLNDIKQILDSNSKEVINKLIRLLQPGQGNLHNAEQLKEIVSLLNQTMPSNNPSSQEILTKTILLYLPWLPLVQQQDVALKLEERQNEENEQENVALIMYISTMSLGRFKVIIILNKNNSLNTEIENDRKDENTEYLQQILKNIDQEMASNKISSKTTIYPQEFRIEKEPDKRELSLYPVSNISPKVMMAAYAAAKIIFEIDEGISIAENRKKMLK